MPRGSRHLDEPALYIHPETQQQRTATTKVEVVTLEADGFRPAAEVQDEQDAAARSEAAKKAAATRARNAKKAAEPQSNVDTVTVDTPQTPEPNSGSDE